MSESLNVLPQPLSEAHDYESIAPPAEFAEALWPLDNLRNTEITNEIASLGRLLFYDPQISASGTVSCSSCHHPKAGFSDPRARSVGVSGEELPRNSMSLINARYAPSGKYFWDERASSLREQVLMPIQHVDEMGTTLDDLIKHLSEDETYSNLFEVAFGNREATPERISMALTQFIGCIVSFDSKYDRGLIKHQDPLVPFENFTAQENRGKEIFMTFGQCAKCHLPGSVEDDLLAAPLPQQAVIFQTAFTAANGIDSDLPDSDLGVASQSSVSTDRGKFKVGTLRNLSLTAPYMHDGRFASINLVLEHYNWSVRPHPNLDPRLEEFAYAGLAISQIDKEALESFLLTLQDETIANDPRLSNPFESALESGSIVDDPEDTAGTP
ncbi:MAG: cytochrome c peroxidase [Planctomycetota bacterium]